jgi:two-component system chemotaxis response regulator CheY
MNGIELIERMEADGLLKSIPVVVTRRGQRTRMDALKAKGIKGYIRKPFSPETIKKILLEILGEGPK